MRLDQHLHKLFPNFSRALIQKLIKSGHVKVNGAVLTKTGQTLKGTEKVEADFNLETNTDQILELPIIYEDDGCVVLNKPAGVLTHSKGAYNPEPTVATWLATRKGYAFKDESENMRAGIVHRLDRATSGVMICAKNPNALKHLQKQFQDRKAKKTYIARVQDRVRPEKAIIDLPIERNPKQPQRFRVGANGKPAITAYETLEYIEDKKIGIDSLLELKPMTGRTHQLRVHMHYLKHPIVGDTFYDGRKARRLYLHAHLLEITLPSKERVTFEAPMPNDFVEASTQ